MEVAHRHKVCRGKFCQHAYTLLSQHISLQLWVNLFEATITPTVLFGLASAPVTKRGTLKLDALRRRMLRRIVGWVRSDEELGRQLGNKRRINVFPQRGLVCMAICIPAATGCANRPRAGLKPRTTTAFREPLEQGARLRAGVLLQRSERIRGTILCIWPLTLGLGQIPGPHYC